MSRYLTPAVATMIVVSRAVGDGGSDTSREDAEQRAWLQDTAQALSGSRAYVARRVADTAAQLALNLDIDNTSLQTYYDRGRAIPATLRLVRYAKSRGVAILFNTGRPVSEAQERCASSGARASRSTTCAPATVGSR